MLHQFSMGLEPFLFSNINFRFSQTNIFSIHLISCCIYSDVKAYGYTAMFSASFLFATQDDEAFTEWSTVKNIRRFYDKITGNQLPVHFPLFFTGARKRFQESGTER